MAFQWLERCLSSGANAVNQIGKKPQQDVLSRNNVRQFLQQQFMAHIVKCLFDVEKNNRCHSFGVHRWLSLLLFKALFRRNALAGNRIVSMKPCRAVLLSLPWCFRKHSKYFRSRNWSEFIFLLRGSMLSGLVLRQRIKSFCYLLSFPVISVEFRLVHTSLGNVIMVVFGEFCLWGGITCCPIFSTDWADLGGFLNSHIRTRELGPCSLRLN